MAGPHTFAGLHCLVLLVVAHATADATPPTSYSSSPSAMQFGSDAEAERAMESALRALSSRKHELGAMARDLQRQRATAEEHDDLLEQHTNGVLLPFLQSVLENVIRKHGLWQEGEDTQPHNLFAFVRALEKHKEASKKVSEGLSALQDLITKSPDDHVEL